MRVFLSLLLLFFSILSGGVFGETSKDMQCHIRVFDGDANPVVGAEVAIVDRVDDYAPDTRKSRVICRGKTDSGGRVVFTIKPGNLYNTLAVVRKEGFALGWDVLAWEYTPVCQCSIILDKPCKLSGKVVDAKLNPVAGAKVRAIARTSCPERLDQTPVESPGEWFTTTTDKKGCFEFNIFSADAYVDIGVTVGGCSVEYIFTPNYMTCAGYEVGRTDIRLMMAKPVSVKGQVIDSKSGEGIGGMGVVVQPDNKMFKSEGSYKPVTTITDNEGRFEFRGLPAGGHRLKAYTAQGVIPRWFDASAHVVVKEGGNTEDCILEMRVGGLINVEVTDAITKVPVENCSIYVSKNLDHIANVWFTRLQKTDSSGKTVIRAVDGECKVRIWCDGYSRNQTFEPIEVVKGGQKELKIELEPDPSISGVIVDGSGTPAVGVSVVVVPGKGAVITDSAGRFTVGYERDDRNRFLLARDFKRNLACLTAIKNDSKPVRAVLEPALKVKGRIVDQLGKGIAGSRVSIATNVSHMSCPFDPELITDSKGCFELAAAVSSTEKFEYRVSVTKTGYGPKHYMRVKVDDDDGKPVATLEDIVLPDADQTISGRVMDDQGHPVGGVIVFQNAKGQPRKNTVTDEWGEFEIKRLCKGKIRLQAGLSGGEIESGYLTASGGDKGLMIIMGRDN